MWRCGAAKTACDRHGQDSTELTRSRAPTVVSPEEELRQQGITLIAGVDEAGRGCLAGPVVAAAVVIPDGHEIAGVADSKVLTPRQREELDRVIRHAALAWGIGVVSAALIDATDILRATHTAMRLAVQQLGLMPQVILVDGRPVPDLPAPSHAVVRGDSICPSICAASILAKVYRDRIMQQLERVYPGYGFATHKGYGTREHRAALERLGPCPVHRLSFEPLKKTGSHQERLPGLGADVDRWMVGWEEGSHGWETHRLHPH